MRFIRVRCGRPAQGVGIDGGVGSWDRGPDAAGGGLFLHDVLGYLSGSGRIAGVNGDGSEWVADFVYDAGVNLLSVTAPDNKRIPEDLRAGPLQFQWFDRYVDGDRSVPASPPTAPTLTLDGGEGDDALIANDGGTVLIGGAGLDMLLGGTGIDTAFGDAGMGSISTGDGRDQIRLRGGDDYAVSAYQRMGCGATRRDLQRRPARRTSNHAVLQRHAAKNRMVACSPGTPYETSFGACPLHQSRMDCG